MTTRATYPEIIYRLQSALEGEADTWEIDAAVREADVNMVTEPVLRRWAWGTAEPLDMIGACQLAAVCEAIGRRDGSRDLRATPGPLQEQVAGRLVIQRSGTHSLSEAGSALDNADLAVRLGLFDTEEPTDEAREGMEDLVATAGLRLVEVSYDRGYVVGVVTALLEIGGSFALANLRAGILRQVDESAAPLPALEGWLSAVRDDLADAARATSPDHESALGLAAALAAGESVADELARQDLRVRVIDALGRGRNPMDALEDARRSLAGPLSAAKERSEATDATESELDAADFEIEALGRVQGLLVSDEELASMARLRMSRKPRR